MIKLFGFPMSNYYSIVKMCLLEKDVPFEEIHDEITLSTDLFSAGDNVISALRPEYLNKSPIGKVPCIGTPHGYLSETQIILEYLEDAYPRVPLLPQDAFARAKARELARVLDLHVELVIRRVYSEAFFGGSVTPEIKEEVRALVAKAVTGVATLSKLSPYAVGPAFTYVDCVAAIHLPIARAAMLKLYGEDLASTLPNLFSYLARIAERPSYVAATATIQSKLAELGLV